MTTYVVVGLDLKHTEDSEVIGPFKSKKAARDWCEEQGMYCPHIILPLMAATHFIYKDGVAILADSNN